MADKKHQWFNIYYFIIILICLMVGLFIWFLFSLRISSLESQDRDGGVNEKKVSSIKRDFTIKYPGILLMIGTDIILFKNK